MRRGRGTRFTEIKGRVVVGCRCWKDGSSTLTGVCLVSVCSLASHPNAYDEQKVLKTISGKKGGCKAGGERVNREVVDWKNLVAKNGTREHENRGGEGSVWGRHQQYGKDGGRTRRGYD